MVAEYEGADVPKVRGTYAYYRQPDGWITASPGTNTDELRYRRSGWEPLLEFGYFEMSTVYSIGHPLEPLFMRGGAHMLTVDQIRRQGLYLDPPIVPNCLTPLGQDHKRHTRACLRNAPRVTFPQLEGVEGLGPFPCEMGCPERVFPTTEARDQHVTVMHAPEKSDERTGQSLAGALLVGLGGQQIAGTPGIAAILAKVEAMEAELAALKQAKGQDVAQYGAYQPLFHATCSRCGREFNSVKQQYADRALNLHRRQRHPAVDQQTNEDSLFVAGAILLATADTMPYAADDE